NEQYWSLSANGPSAAQYCFGLNACVFDRFGNRNFLSVYAPPAPKSSEEPQGSDELIVLDVLARKTFAIDIDVNANNLTRSRWASRDLIVAGDELRSVTLGVPNGKVISVFGVKADGKALDPIENFISPSSVYQYVIAPNGLTIASLGPT